VAVLALVMGALMEALELLTQVVAVVAAQILEQVVTVVQEWLFYLYQPLNTQAQLQVPQL
jgi:uncharacterized membrane protein